MSYVFSKALMQNDEKAKQQQHQQQSINLPNKIPPPVSCKPGSRKTSQQPPPVKKKPLTKSHSVDSAQKDRSRSVDLTVVGGSEWKDFVLKRQKEREAREALEEATQQDDVNGSRRSSSSSNTSFSTDGVEETTYEPRRRTLSSSSYTREGVHETSGERREFRRTLSTSGRIRIPSLDLTQVGNDEWKQISARKGKERLEAEKKELESETQGQPDVQQTSETTEAKDLVSKIVDGEWKKVESPENEEEVTQKIVIKSTDCTDYKEEFASSQIVNGEWKKVKEVKEEEVVVAQIVSAERKKPKEDISPAKTTELLQSVPEQTVMMDETKSAVPPPVPPVTLPKPRKIGAELKRHSFASRSGSSSMSKSFACGDAAPVIKRSSDMMTETKKASRGERSLSFDTQTPYFCRLPRSLSIELEETLTQCEISLKTPRSASIGSTSSAGDVFEPIPPMSPISSLSEVTEDISQIEKSPDIIAMKNEIAVERSKKELERKTLSDTIDEMESFELELDNLINTKNDNVFDDVTSSQPISTSEVKVLEEPSVNPADTTDQLVEEKSCAETAIDPSTTISQNEEADKSDIQSDHADVEAVNLSPSNTEVDVKQTDELPSENKIIPTESSQELASMAADSTEKTTEPGCPETHEVELTKEPILPSTTELPEEPSPSAEDLSSNGPIDVKLSNEGKLSEDNATPTVEPPLPTVSVESEDTPPQIEIPSTQASNIPVEKTVEETADIVPASTDIKAEELPEEICPQIQNIHEQSEELVISSENESTDGQLITKSVEITQEIDTEVSAAVCTETDVPKTENESVDMTVEEFSSMINASNVTMGINEPVITLTDGSASIQNAPQEETVLSEINDVTPSCNDTSTVSDITTVQSTINMPNTSVEPEGHTVGSEHETNVSNEIPNGTSTELESNKIDITEPCVPPVTEGETSVITETQNAINDVVQCENQALDNVKSEHECNNNQDSKLEADNEISYQQIPLEQKPAVSSEVREASAELSEPPSENGVEEKLPCPNESTGVVVETVTVDTEEKLQSPTPPSEQESNHKNSNDIPAVKNSDMNQELVDSYVNIEHNGVLNGNQMETNDIKLLSEKGFNERVIFV